VVLHRTSDADHHRSVITYAGLGDSVVESAVRAAQLASKLIDLTEHRGVHPRLGALDVLPFVPLSDTSLEYCVELAHAAGHRIWNELGIPVYFYEAAAQKPERVKLEHVRRGEFEGVMAAIESDPSRRPDIGGSKLHATAGATIIGARKFLIAYNINLRTEDVGIAKAIARSIRTSSGGFPAVKALGLPLPSRGMVQVSMNLTDFEQTPIHVVFLEVARLAAQSGVEIEESELIGLMPRKALEMAAAGFLKLHDFRSDRVVETRMESALLEKNQPLDV
jgi:glutamate formiminotransferase